MHSNEDNDVVDIANSSFHNLPADLQAENIAAATVALNTVLDAITQGCELNDQTIEQLSSIIHQAWLKRNSGSAKPSQRLEYDQLSEPDKLKDRKQIIKTLQILGYK